MRSAWLLALAVLAAGSPAAADDVDDLAKRGLELRRQHRDAEALEVFRQVLAASPSARARAQIALAEQALGRWMDAEVDLAHALDDAADPWIVRNANALNQSLAEIRGHLGWLDVTADVDGADLSVNGVARGSLPSDGPVRVEAGSLVLAVSAPGYVTATKITSVAPGGRARETVRMLRLQEPEPPPQIAASSPAAPPATSVDPPPRDDPRPNHALRAAGVVVLAAGAAAVATGVYFGVRTLDFKHERDDHCAASGCDPIGVARDQDARAAATRSTAWILGGLAGAATGVALVWFSAPKARTQTGRLMLRGDVSPTHAGATLGGSF